MSDQIADVRPGQRWRLTSGDEVTVDAVSDDQVEGTVWSQGTIAVWVKRRRDLVGAKLLAPVFRVRIEGAEDERAWRIAERAGEIERGSTTGGRSVYFIDVPAADAKAALQVVRDAC